MTLRLNGSTSGYTEIDAPAVAGSNTLVLPTGNGSDGNILGTDGAGNLSWVGGRMVLATAQNTTSGTAIDFTGIPSWVKRVTVTIADVSTNSSNASLLQFGSSNTIQTTDYKSRTSFVGGNTATSTSGFIWGVTGGGAGNTYRGSIVATLVGSNVWVATGMVDVQDGNGNVNLNAGRVTLSGALDILRIQAGTAGTETFDAGTVNILYEG
jgi:hypothetical protein